MLKEEVKGNCFFGFWFVENLMWSGKLFLLLLKLRCSDLVIKVEMWWIGEIWELSGGGEWGWLWGEWDWGGVWGEVWFVIGKELNWMVGVWDWLGSGLFMLFY